jgi:hypothetical protein
MRYALPVDYALSGVTPTKCLVCTTLSSDTTTNCLLCSACRYYSRLSAALLCLSILQLTIHSTDYPLCSLWHYSTDYPITPTDYAMCSTLLCIAILQTTILCTLPADITTDHPLCSLWHSSTDYAMPSTLFTDTTTDYQLSSAFRYDN